MRGLATALVGVALLAGGCATDDFIFVDDQGLNILAIDAVEANKPALILDVRAASEKERAPSRPTWLQIQYGFDDWNAPRIMMREDDAAFIRAVDAVVEGNRATPILVLCNQGQRSAFAARVLRHAGFTQAWNVLDGIKGNRLGHGWLFAEEWHGVAPRAAAAKR